MCSMKCLIGLHKYEIYKEEPLKNCRDEEIGKVLICRCQKCGHIGTTRVKTKDTILY